jgi:DNA polymerase-4
MQLPINKEDPQIMHVDLNSCFATVEQQARPLLRGQPVGVTNRISKYCCIIAASYEAKALGIKVGMRRDEALELAPNLVMTETDPPKYHYVYKKLLNILSSYSDNVVMKSIDEGVIDFHGTRQNINKRELSEIGYEIKARLINDVGSWMRCNVGIGPNRFLAKVAAGLHKPDGLDVIDHNNLVSTYKSMKLTDIHGIAERNEARLNAVGIMTPIEFLNAPSEVLRRQVFKSVCGEDWYKRLRGHEVDQHSSGIVRMVGRQYVLDIRRPSDQEVRTRLSYLCETTGMKLRYRGLCARGVMVHVRYANGDSWYERKMFKSTFFTNAEVYRRATLLFNKRPRHDFEREIGISCYALTPSNMSQISLLEDINKDVWLTQALDQVNNQYGEFTITSATSYKSKNVVKQKIPFGSTQYFELLLKSG